MPPTLSPTMATHIGSKLGEFEYSKTHFNESQASFKAVGYFGSGDLL
ncbi:MAG TPA: hypothetical protein VFM31_05845 [Nitrososphaeraceae archaeon]|nr:hypothetical protein [Nitrososphaeraceae archaeon]